jgi:mRNA interferase MazF
MSASKAGAKPVRGEVWLASLDPIVGREQAGSRPVLIVSDDHINRSPLEMVVVAPITGTDRGIPLHVKIVPRDGGLAKPSVIMTEQIRAISQRRLKRCLGTVAASTMMRVENCLMRVLNI